MCAVCPHHQKCYIYISLSLTSFLAGASTVLVTDTHTEHILWSFLGLILCLGLGTGLHIPAPGTKTGLDVVRISSSKTAGLDVANCTGLEMVLMFDLNVNVSTSNVLIRVSDGGAAVSGLDTSDLDARVFGSNTSALDVQNNVSRSNVPRSDVPGSNVPGSDVPGSDVPGSNVPRSDVPGSNVPRSDVPGSNVPGSDVPGSNIPRSDGYICSYSDRCSSSDSDLLLSKEPFNDPPSLSDTPPTRSVITADWHDRKVINLFLGGSGGG